MEELGILIRWGRVVPGRELEAADLFAETTKFFGDLLASGALTYFEPFTLLSGDYESDNGFMIVKGPTAKINEIFEGEDALRLKAKSVMILSHVTTELLCVGEEVIKHVSLLTETAQKVPAGVA